MFSLELKRSPGNVSCLEDDAEVCLLTDQLITGEERETGVLMEVRQEHSGRGLG